MKNKKLYAIIAIVWALIVGYFLTLESYPKNAERYPFFLVLVLIDVYLCLKIKKHLNPAKKKRNLLILMLFLAPLIALSLAMCVAFFYSRSEWNHNFTIGFFGFIFSGFSAKLAAALLLLPVDLLKLLFPKKECFKKRACYVDHIMLSLGGILFIVLILSVFFWTHKFNVHRIEIPIASLPKQLDGYRIVQLSDTHFGNWMGVRSFERAVDTVLALKPDMIVFTGDFVDFRTEEAEAFETVLRRLKAKNGIFTVLGNHDYGDYSTWKNQEDKKQNFNDLLSFYEKIGWKLLRNEHVIIDINGAEIGLIGVENWSRKSRFPCYGDLAQATESIDSVAIKMLLSHDPSLWDAEVLKIYPDIDITLSGHTHGFQFGIESRNRNFKWSLAQYIYLRWAGYYENDSTNQILYVNRGLGVVAFHGRIGIKPEITLIKLQNKI